MKKASTHMKASYIYVSIVSLLVVGCLLFIAIRKASSSPDFATLVHPCEVMDSVNKKQCWEDVVRKVVGSQGVDTGLDLLSFLYDHDKDFASPCHDITHKIGQMAYDIFAKGNHLQVSEKMAYCSFGFYHGFMETLVARKGDIAQARAFCEYVDKELGSKTPSAKYGCYHGIGHGSTDIHNPKYYGNETAVVAPALVMCEKFAQTQEQLKLCATGVFDSVSIAYYNKQNGFIMKPDDPLWLCHAQPEKYKESCYRDMMPAIMWLGSYDFAKAAPFVERFVEEPYRVIAMGALSEDSMRFIISSNDIFANVPVCRTVLPDLVSSCVGGLGSGIMQFGPPGNEYKGALAFCRNGPFTDSERQECFASVFSYAKGRYSPSMVEAICNLTEDPYKKDCLAVWQK